MYENLKGGHGSFLPPAADAHAAPSGNNYYSLSCMPLGDLQIKYVH